MHKIEFLAVGFADVLREGALHAKQEVRISRDGRVDHTSRIQTSERSSRSQLATKPLRVDPECGGAALQAALSKSLAVESIGGIALSCLHRNWVGIDGGKATTSLSGGA
jgi:hypothetical protein